MNENEQQNIQIKPTPLSPPPSYKNLIIGVVVVFVLVVGGIAGGYFLTKNKQTEREKTEKAECENSGGIYIGCPAFPGPNMGLCVPCKCSQGSNWSVIKKECIGVTKDNIDETVDISEWKTYRNEEYGFEFRYPEDITTSERVHGGEESTFLITTLNSPDQKLEVRSYTRDYIHEAGGAMQNYPRCFFQEKLIYNEKLEISIIDETTFKKDQWVACGNGQMLAHKDNFFFVISENEQQNIIFIEQILSTFKFIEQKSTNATNEPEDTQTEMSINSNTNKIKNNIVEKAHKLLIMIGKLPNTSIKEDVEEYVLPPLQDRPFMYYCGDNFILQYIGGEYHKLEYYSSASFRKIDECEATWYIGGELSPASCSVANTCIPVRDFLYPLTLQTDKLSYNYGDKITVILASNENRNETVELEDLGGNYCAGISLERIGKSSNDWIQDYIELPGSHDIRDCPYSITVSPNSSYKVIIRIDDTATVPSGKWRVVHESEFASLVEGFWLVP